MSEKQKLGKSPIVSFFEAMEQNKRIKEQFKDKYMFNSNKLDGLFELNTQKIQESIDKCVNLLKESVRLSNELKKRKAMKEEQKSKQYQKFVDNMILNGMNEVDALKSVLSIYDASFESKLSPDELYGVFLAFERMSGKSIYEKIKGASISVDKLSEQLNKLKDNEAMKITEETKIKDLIPEGYEFNQESPMEYFKSSCNVTIPVKKKEVKDFRWYVDKYFENKYYDSPSGRSKLIQSKNAVGTGAMLAGDFNSIPFEFKIGLLKFICDDLNVDLNFAIFRLNYKTYDGSIMPIDKKFDSICPPEFLNSIFK